jgi:dTDP-4-amino-4,6-dideoxygalactose transaminase
MNSRLDELQAAILRVKLKHLQEDTEARRRLASMYSEGLDRCEGLTLPVEKNGYHHVYHLYVIRHKRRDELHEYLRSNGIGTAIHFPVAIHQQPAYEGKIEIAPSGLTETEKAAAEVLSLPMYPQLKCTEVVRVIDAIKIFS